MESKILEKDLFKPIHDYFEKLGYNVNGEVKDCDITALKDNELIIIELKRSLNLQLLIQAVKRQRITENVYIAIPRPNYSTFSKKWRNLCLLVRRLELGLITVSFENNIKTVNIVIEPSFFDRKKSMQSTKKKRKNITNEIDGRHGNYNVGGSTRTKLLTAYKENSIHIACCLETFDKLSPKKLKELGTGNKTQSILNKNYYGWFEKIERGIYKLTEKGQIELKEYPHLKEYYSEIINKHKENL